jgi:uncharacterized protein
MSLPDLQILQQNPWWQRDQWRADDAHLTRLRRQPHTFEADPLADIALHEPGVHIVRGPRQVGKSTSLKRLVVRALENSYDRHHIIYLAGDLLEGQSPTDLYVSVMRAKHLAGATGTCLLMLDEVTVVDKWQNAVKSLWDDGLIHDDIVVCTGSSAVDLRHGTAERLPGRRRRGQDVLVLPQSFASVTRAGNDAIPPSPQMDLADLVSPSGRSILTRMQVHLPTLQLAMERYLRFGGLPAAVAEMLAGDHEPSGDTKRILHDALVKEVGRRGASTSAAHALLERVIRSLGSKTNWADMAREMHVRLGATGRPSRRAGATGPTVRDYIELMADGYLILILYFWRAGSNSNALSRDKKMYFFDPLVHAVARDYAPGLGDDTPAQVENLLATHLLRRYERTETFMESPSEPQRLHVWAKPSGEIDFLAGGWANRAALEVKYGAVGPGVGANVAKAHPGRPAVVASKDSLVLDRDPYIIAPAALVLWALGT